MISTSWFQREFVEPGRLPLLVCFGAFVVTFVVTRVITRMIRAGKGPFRDHVSPSGVHVHHAVPGVLLLITGAFCALVAHADEPLSIFAGLLIGVGTSLVLDEFALILRLDDVYWSEEGRISVEMVSLAVACLCFALIGISPVELPTDDAGFGALAASLGVIALHVAVILACVFKGKYRTALFGAFIPLVGAVGAVRLARPNSRWAKKTYGDKRMERARARSARWDRYFGRAGGLALDFVAGRPSRPEPVGDAS